MRIIAQITEVLEAADHAASQDFRWWFVVLLIIGLIVAYGLFQHFEKLRMELKEECSEARKETAEARRETAESREQFSEHLEGQNGKLMVVLGDNTAAMNRLAEVAHKLTGIYK